MKTPWSIQLRHSYLASPDYMIIQTWICVTLLPPDPITSTGPSLYKYINLYPR